MSWLNFFQTTSPCQISFGRGINATINPKEEELFNNSYKAFESGEILKAYEYFFSSLINFTDDVSNENVTLERRDDRLLFNIYQGSAKVNGVITKETLQAEVTLVKNENASVALKRYILERNYQLTYTNYFSDDNYIKLKLYLDNITLSPQKIFFPLRELALNADFDKEHIVSEFQDIPLEEIGHISKLDSKELEIKYAYLQKEIHALDAKVLTLPSNDNAGMQAFLYLGILLKFDYMLVPNYKIYHKLSKKIQAYFGDEHGTIEAKNDELRKYVQELKELSFDEFSSNFYTAKYTFNPIEKTSYEDLVTFISESINKIKWYKNNRYPQIIPTIYRYIAFYSLYNYGVNPVLKELLHTLVQIQNASFFDSINCGSLYNEEKQTFSKRAIVSKLQEIVTQNQEQYKSLVIFIDDLNFNSMNDFSNSYYSMLKNLDFEEL
ncbi:MAG: hypothetical protein U9N39_05075 [Campylobacterota bacterium]|nr:hypothetical protein [Campylobacterota bacterium]